MRPTTKANVSDYGLLIILALVFASSFSFTGISVRHIPPLTLTAARLSIGTLIMLPILLLSHQKLPGFGKIWLYIVASAFFSTALPFTLNSWGQVKVSAGLTAIFMAIMPLGTLFLAHRFTNDEKFNRMKLCGVSFGIFGVTVLMGFDNLTTLGDQTARQLAIVAAALCYAVNAIITKKLLSIPKKAMMFSLLCASTAMILPLSLWLDAPWTLNPPNDAIYSVIALAIGPTVFATFMILLIIERQGASFLSQVNFLVPVFGVMIAVLLLHESLPLRGYIALLLILVGIALTRIGADPRKAN